MKTIIGKIVAVNYYGDKITVKQCSGELTTMTLKLLDSSFARKLIGKEVICKEQLFGWRVFLI